MAISSDPNDPNFGLEADQSSPDFGLPEKSAPAAEIPLPKSGAQMDSLAAREIAPQLQAGVEAAAAAVPEAIKGAQTAATAVINPLSFASEAITPKPVADFMRQELVSPEAVDTVRQAAQYPVPTLTNLLFGTDFKEQGALAGAGQFVSRQIAAQTTPENIALIAGTEGLGALEKGLAKTAPGLAETLFGGANKEAAALTAETAKAVEPVFAAPPPVPKEHEIPQLMGSPTFELVPEPKPKVAPVQPLEEQVAGLQGQKIRQTPEGDVPVTDEMRGGRTGVQSETARVGGEPLPVSQPTETTTAQPLSKEPPTVPPVESTPALEVKAEPVVPPEKVQPGEFGQKGYTAVDTADQPALSRIANRHTEERAAAGELGQIAPGQGYSKMDLVKQGEKMAPEEVNQHVSDLMQKTGDPIKQASAVSVEEARLSKRSSDLSRAAQADPTNVDAKLAADNAFKDLTDFHVGPVARLKEVFHGTGEGLQGEVPVDLTTVNGFREAYFKDTGKLPTASMDKNFESTAARVSKSIEEDNGARTTLSTEIEKQSASRKLPSYDEVRNNIRERMGLEPCAT